MKNLIFPKTIIALAVALAAAGNHSQAQEQPIPPPVADILPAGIPPGSALEQVYKLVRAGVDVSVVKNYISNSASAFNLDAEKIIALTDAGVPTDIVNAMMAHDKNYTPVATVASSSPVNTVSVPDSAPPAEPVTVNYFYSNLSPYGNWVEVEGYGRCWRPTVVVYDSTWSPYCDRGHWVYTDAGWYWDSDYSWGATFHYGRWFRHDRIGWCWYPDTVWAPSWVTWRSSDTHCGWAPLPPFSEYRPGVGFYYRGSGVSIGFDFGLRADCFTFVSVGRMYERHPRYYREDHEHVNQIFNQTTIINNYNVTSGRHTVVNNGISVDRVRTASSRPIRPVAVAELPNAARQGWRGDNNQHDQRPGNVDSRPTRAGQTPTVTPGTPSGSYVRQPAAPVRPGNDNVPSHPPTTRPEPNRGNQHERDAGNHNSIQTPATIPPANNNPGQRNTIVTPPSTSHDRPQTPAVRQPDRTTTIPPRAQTPAVRQSEPPTISVPQRSQTQPQPPQRPYSTPAAPVVSEHRQQREPQRSESLQSHQNVPEASPRNYAPRQTDVTPPSSSSQQSGSRDRDKDKGNH